MPTYFSHKVYHSAVPSFIPAKLSVSIMQMWDSNPYPQKVMLIDTFTEV